MSNDRVSIIGASSLVGQYVIDQLLSAGSQVFAYSRSIEGKESGQYLEWKSLSADVENVSFQENWICLCPIYTICQYKELFRNSGARRIVALSSTSIYTKSLDKSINSKEDVALANSLAEGEQDFCGWADVEGVEWIILRPTLIYDLCSDKNITLIVKLITRLGFFPILGDAEGLRQPVHANDVAWLAISALKNKQFANQSYNIAGGEALTYHAMVARLFERHALKPRFLKIPAFIYKIAFQFLRVIPRYKNFSFAMAQRMNSDHVFEYANATRDFDYQPRKFLASENKLQAK